MPFVSDELFNEICMSNDIIDYASSYMTLKKNGRSYKACCPFHNEKTPSFNIDRDRQLFHCFGCGASGNFVQLVMRLEGLDYRDAMRALAERAGIIIPENGIRESDAMTKKKELPGQFLLGLLNKLFFALGAGDGNFAFSLGYPHLLTAAGAIIIPVVLILQLLEEQQELPVFIIALINIPGQCAADCQNHKAVRNQGT